MSLRARKALFLTVLGQVSGGGGFVGPYDAIPSIAAAYGMRRLRSAYTGNLLRLRRSSDNAEQDFGYLANGDLDAASIATFIGGGSGLVVTWYDQSGNGNNATQSTANAQPLYVASGQNSKPVTRYDGTNDRMATAAFASPLAQQNSLLVVGKITNGGGYFVDGLTSGNRHAIGKIGSSNTTHGLFAGALLSSASNSSNYVVAAALFNGASSTLHLNGSSVASGDAGAHALDGLTIGDRFSSSSSLLNGDIAELIVSGDGWTAQQRQLAEAAANAYWGVY